MGLGNNWQENCRGEMGKIFVIQGRMGVKGQ